MKCTSCGHTQEHGKFCGKCGAPFLDTTSEPVQTPPAPDQVPTAQTLNSLKNHSQLYFGYFFETFKRPSSVFQQSSQTFGNGLISIIVFGLLVSLSIARLANFFGFFEVFIRVSLLLIPGLFIPVIGIWLSTLLSGLSVNFKQIINYYGAHLGLPIAMATIGFFLALINPLSISTSIFIMIAFSIALSVTPLFLISSILTRLDSQIDPWFGLLIGFVVIGILYFISGFIFGDQLVAYDLWNEFWYDYWY